jgi:hypothetical protein
MEYFSNENLEYKTRERKRTIATNSKVPEITRRNT